MSITTIASPDGREVVVELVDEVEPWPLGLPVDWFEVSDEQRAFARELRVADLVEELERTAADDVDGWDPSRTWDLEPTCADDLVVALSGPAHEMELALLASLDPAELETNKARIAYLQGLDRLAARVAAMRAEILVELAGAVATGDYLLEQSLEHEVAVARRSSSSGAGKAIETARALASTFPGFAAALRAGEVSEAHCMLLVDKTRAVTDPLLLTAIEERVLRKAKRLPVGRFGKEVAAAVVELDPDAVRRHRRAKEQRGVYSRQLDDGLGFLGVVDEWGVISAIQATIDADAHVLHAQRGGAAAVTSAGARQDASGETPAGTDRDSDARMGACRADALAARVLGSLAADGTVTWDPRESVQVTVDLVIDLGTLRGEADRMALLADQPVPAQIAREHADAVRTWRRVVTDPVDGHLLDYGTRQYLPDRLRRYVLARDGGCIAPTARRGRRTGCRWTM